MYCCCCSCFFSIHFYCDLDVGVIAVVGVQPNRVINSALLYHRLMDISLVVKGVAVWEPTESHSECMHFQSWPGGWGHGAWETTRSWFVQKFIHTILIFEPFMV